jgi:hypothetical protein
MRYIVYSTGGNISVLGIFIICGIVFFTGAFYVEAFGLTGICIAGIATYVLSTACSIGYNVYNSNG